MNISPKAKHNLINVSIIILPTVLAYVVYYLGGGNFERDMDLGFTTLGGFMFSFVAAAFVAANRGSWK